MGTVCGVCMRVCVSGEAGDEGSAVGSSRCTDECLPYLYGPHWFLSQAYLNKWLCISARCTVIIPVDWMGQ